MSNRHDRRALRRARPPRIRLRRSLTMERLCDRRVLAAITGMVFEDANQTLRLDADEAGLEDRIVYLDLNQDGRPGFGEPLQRTTAEGGFQFDGLASGDYVVQLYNGSQSQRQTYPIAPQLDDALLQISDVQLQATSFDGSLVYGLVDDLVVRIDAQSSDIQTLDLGGRGRSVHPLPDGSQLVLADPAFNSPAAAWIVRFDEATVSVIDFGLYAGESGWATATLNAEGQGVLTADSESGDPTTLRRLSFENGQLIATPTAFDVAPGTMVLSEGSLSNGSRRGESPNDQQGTLSLFAIPQDQGLQLIQWSNASGQVVPGSVTTIADGVRLEAFDEPSGLVVVRDQADALLVLDAANDYALLNRIFDLPGPVAVDGLRDLLYGQDEDSNLVVYDIQAMQTSAVVTIPLPRAGGMALINDGQSMLLGGDYAVLRVQLERPTGHRVNLPDDQASADVLFGLFVQEANTAPAFQSSPIFSTAEDTKLTRPEPTLLVHGIDEDQHDEFIVLKASDPGAGTAKVGPGGNLVYTPGRDVFGQDRFDIVLHDGRSVSDPTPVHINIAPVNDPLGPILVDIMPVIPENIRPGVPLGEITIVNVDVGEQIDIQVDHPWFDIHNGQLVLVEGAELDFENLPPHELTIIATHVIHAEPPEDSYYELISTTVPIRIGDVNEPVLGVNLSSSFSITENVPGPAWVGEVYVIDQDYTGEYSFEVDDDRFEVRSGRLQLKPEAVLDYETDHGMELKITVHDGPFQASDTFAIDVLDVNEVITGIAFPARTIMERIEGAVVGQMQVDDPDHPTTARLSVNDSRFEFVGTTLKLRDGVSVNSEQQIISLVLTVTDDSYPPFTDQLDVDLTVLENPLPFHNPDYPLDVDGNGSLDPSDVLLIINYLNQHGPGPIEQDNVSGAPVYYDVNGDGMVTPLDALLVINQLNLNGRTLVDPSVGGESEAPQNEAVPLVESPPAAAGDLANENPANENRAGENFAADDSADENAAVGESEPSLADNDAPSSYAAIDQAVGSYYRFDDEDDDEDEDLSLDDTLERLI